MKERISMHGNESQESEMEQYNQFAGTIAKQAGEIMRKNYALGMKRVLKSDRTPVTESDTAINSLVIQEIKKHFPNHSIRGEEESDIQEKSEYTWVCDPIDGTIPFSRGIPLFTFSLALTRNGESVLGVVYDPSQNRLFSAIKGKGATLNGEAIHVSNSSDFGTSTAATILSSIERYNTKEYIDHLMYQEKVRFMNLAAIVFPSALVAAGELDFVIFAHDTAHDGAAIRVLVEEAGGKVTNLFGDDQRYDQPIKGFIASNGVLHEQLVEIANRFVDKTPRV